MPLFCLELVELETFTYSGQRLIWLRVGPKFDYRMARTTNALAKPRVT